MSTKSELLKELERNKGSYISGEELAERLSLSRTAIWKAVNKLKEEGYQIVSEPKKGYRLALQNDLLSVEGILPFLTMQEVEGKIHIYKSLESTNQEAKQMALHGAPHGTVVLAERQTSGRGRFGRCFYSPEGTGIYMSLVLRPKISIAGAVRVTTAASVAVCRAIEKVTGKVPQIKWVNDLQMDGKKICGILTEATTDFESGSIESIILGIGINFTTGSFPEELKHIATSLYEVKPDRVTRNQLVAEVMNQLELLEEMMGSRNYLEEYRARSVVLGSRIQILTPSKTENAVAINIDDDGGLIVEMENGEIKTLNSGEVSIRRSDI